MEHIEKQKIISICKLILRILIGTFFITTAVLKLLSLDNFEIYIYSFKLFDFILCTIIARWVIAAELLFGILLIAKIFYKQVWWLTMAMLFGFTLLLIYTAIFRNDANCHCMGDLVQISPVVSIFKNLLTMALMLLIRKEHDYHFKGRFAVTIAALVIAIGIPFILFPMDSVVNHFRSNETKVDMPQFQQFMKDSTIQALNLDEGKYIVAYLAAGCQYCEISGRKVNTIVDNQKLDTNRIVYFIWGKDQKIKEYKKITGATHFKYVTISPLTAVKIVYGQFPTYLFLQDGKIVKTADYRHLDDKSITDFLKKQ